VPPLERFRRDADWIGVQRHLKVIGIFARLHHRDGKPKYLQDVPRFFAYLDDVLPRYREFDGLRALITERVRPALAARASA
jgi:aminoglycoside/choline kinase family phosphotransferase